MTFITARKQRYDYQFIINLTGYRSSHHNIFKDAKVGLYLVINDGNEAYTVLLRFAATPAMFCGVLWWSAVFRHTL